MSAPSISPIRITAVTVSSESAKRPKRLTSGEIRIGTHRHALICEDGTLCQEFPNVVELLPDTQIVLYYKAPLLQVWSKTQKMEINARRLFEKFYASQMQDLSVIQNGIRIVFSHEAAETISPTPYPPEARPTTETLIPTTEAILEECPQFRILVIGKSGVGKSSLINTTFGINKASSADLQRGIADIEEGLESPVNKRFILHDSLGFEPGDTDNYDTVKGFIQRRRTGELKDQLHAVWFCVQTPLAGGRLLEVAAEDFFRTRKRTMGTIPLIVVYTKFDPFVDQLMLRSIAPSGAQLDEESLTRQARSKAASSVQELHDEINRLAGESLPHAVVSTRKRYEYTLQDLVELTHQQVGMRDTTEAQITSVVTLMAQRVAPNLNVQGCIDVGRRRYWKALKASVDFAGHKMWDCLSVIHTDIVAIWNFNDPDRHLLDDEFKQLVIGMVQEMETPSAPKHDRNLAVWLYDVYQNVKNVQQIFIAFIVDLTHIMETLLILTSRDHNELTRRAIKHAYITYHNSEVMRQAHVRIQKYRDLDGRDAALDMIKSLIKPEQDGGSSLKDYYARVGELDVVKLNLDQEEDW